MPPFALRAFRSDDYSSLAALATAVRPDAPMTGDELVREDRTVPSYVSRQRIVAEVGGRVAGVALYDQNPGMYHPHVFNVDVMVSPGHRGAGIGAALHARIVQLLVPHHPTKRLARVREDDPIALAFGTRRGYREAKRDIHSALLLDRFDPSRWQHVLVEADAAGYRFLDLAEVRGDAGRIRAYYEQFSSVRADVPRSLPATPVAFDLFATDVVEQPDAVAEATILAFRGNRCVGFTQVYASAASPELQTGLTGVDRAHRRRGLATALKVTSLTAAKAAGAESIRTDNDSRNAAMLAVNDALGFERRPAQITLAWEASGHDSP